MTILSANQGVVFTTRALTFDQAHRFARCCNANGQYTEVTVKPNGRGKFVVSYQPTSAARIEKLTAAFQGTREERAAAQAHCYEITEVAGVHEVANLISGVIYTVRDGRCDCPDYSYRCDGNCQCKHGLMVRNHGQQARETQLLSSVDVSRLAAIRARMSEDFPEF
jgi:hypothetical protein